MRRDLIGVNDVSIDGIESYGIDDIALDDEVLTEEDMAQAIFEESCTPVDYYWDEEGYYD